MPGIVDILGKASGYFNHVLLMRSFQRCITGPVFYKPLFKLRLGARRTVFFYHGQSLVDRNLIKALVGSFGTAEQASDNLRACGITPDDGRVEHDLVYFFAVRAQVIPHRYRAPGRGDNRQLFSTGKLQYIVDGGINHGHQAFGIAHRFTVGVWTGLAHFRIIIRTTIPRQVHHPGLAS